MSIVARNVSATRYLRGAGAVQFVGEHCRHLGSRAVLMGGRTALSVSRAAILESCRGAGVEVAGEAWYGGQCSETNVCRLAGWAGEKEARVIIGVGGGRALDTAKAVAYRLNLPVVTVPTIAATCAAWTPLSVFYTDGGTFIELSPLSRYPSAVVVDSTIIANAPVRLLAAGVGDTLAKWFELDVSSRRAGGAVIEAARGVAGLCYDTLLTSGPGALEAVRTRAVTGDLEQVVDAVIMLSGMVSALGGDECRTAAAHAIYSGLTRMPATHSRYHGEVVAFGIIGQLLLDAQEGAAAELAGRYLPMGLPVTLSELGLGELSAEEWDLVAEGAVETEDMRNMPFAVTPEMVIGAVKGADKIGRELLKRSGREQDGLSGEVKVPVLQGAKNARDLQAFPAHLPDLPAGLIKARLGLDRVYKLSFNENPYGPPPGAVEAMKKAAETSHLYPDAHGVSLRETIAGVYALDPKNVVLSNGADEMIVMLAQAFLDPGDEVVIPHPSFGAYIAAAKMVGAVPITVGLKNYTVDLDAVLEKVGLRTKLIFICNPNNPTGTMVSGEELEGFLARLPGHVMPVLDEAYMEYGPDPGRDSAVRFVRQNRNVMVIRTFSKIYGLAAARVGYLLAPSGPADWVNKVRAPFNVNYAGQLGAEAALADRSRLERIREMNAAERTFLAGSLEKLGLTCVPSHTNFILADTGIDCDAVFEGLARRGVIVRPGRPYGLPTHLRITIGTRKENEAVVEGLVAVLGELRGKQV